MTDPTTTEPLDLDGLRKIAEAATPGPWRADYVANEFAETFFVRPAGARIEPERRVRVSIGTTLADEFESGPARRDGPASRVAAHIAAFDPPTVLRLIELAREAEGLKRQRDVAMKFLRERPTAPHPVDQMKNLTKFLREDAEAEVAELTAERDALRAQLQIAREVLELAENLMLAITGNEPDDLIADGGITVWHGIVADAQNWLNIQWPKVEALTTTTTTKDPHP